MASSLFCVILGALLLATVECNCPDGWLTHGTKCYLFSHDSEDWPGAVSMCAMVGGDMAEINSAAESHYVSNQVKLYGGDHWIGMTDVLEEGTWVWANSKAKLATTGYSHWAHGQPDNHHKDENCAYVMSTGGAWADGPCHFSKLYVCEKDNGDAAVLVG